MSDLTLTVSTTRAATSEEIDGMIFGTGALTWDWWVYVEELENGVYEVRHLDETEEPTNTLVTDDQILAAAGIYLSRHEIRTGDIRDAIEENLGYLDADAADSVLQIAVFGEVVFG